MSVVRRFQGAGSVALYKMTGTALLREGESRTYARFASALLSFFHFFLLVVSINDVPSFVSLRAGLHLIYSLVHSFLGCWIRGRCGIEVTDLIDTLIHWRYTYIRSLGLENR